MDKGEKTLLIVGGVVAAGFVLMALYQKSQAAQLAALNEPGLITQPSMAANVGASDVILSATSGAAGWISSLFSKASDNASLNEPGLESDSATDFPGMDYTYDNSNSYATVNASDASETDATADGW